MDNILIVVSGRKRVVLFKPSDALNLYLNGMLNGLLNHQKVKYEYNSHYHAITLCLFSMFDINFYSLFETQFNKEYIHMKKPKQ